MSFEKVSSQIYLFLFLVWKDINMFQLFRFELEMMVSQQKRNTKKEGKTGKTDQTMKRSKRKKKRERFRNNQIDRNGCKQQKIR